MKFIQRIVILIVWGLFLSIQSYGQSSCECLDCPKYMPDFFLGEVSLNIENATFNDLSNPFQGVCGVHFDLEYQYIGDLLIELKAPNGKRITLVGFIGLTGQTDRTTWDISFVGSNETAFPDDGFSEKWSNSQKWGVGNTYTGSYYPYSGRLEDFNLGPVNGTWSLLISDGQAQDVGTLKNFSINFCNSDGIVCNQNSCGLFIDLDYQSLYCATDKIFIDGSQSSMDSDITYLWTTEDGHFSDSTKIHDPRIEVDSSGLYTLTISDSNGCSESKDALIKILGSYPDIVISEIDSISCENKEVLLDASDSGDNLEFLWYKGADISQTDASLGSEMTQLVEIPGVYTLVVGNTISGCTSDTIIDITNFLNYPNVEIPISDTLNCLNPTLDIIPESSTLDAKDTIMWSGPNSFTDSLLSISVVDEGTYYITITNELGCSTQDSIIVIKDTVGLPISVMQQSVSCYGFANGWIDIDVIEGTPPYLTSWSTGDSTLVIENLSKGIYVVNIKDDNGCLVSESIEINEPDSLDLMISSTFSEIDNVGNLQALVTGGTVPYSLLWNTGDTTLYINNVPEGTYSILVMDDNGCIIKKETDLTTAVEGVVNEHEISIYPNPTGDELFIDFQREVDSEISIYTDHGKFVYKTSNSKLKFQVNCNAIGLAAGVYFILIENDFEKVIYRFVKE